MLRSVCVCLWVACECVCVRACFVCLRARIRRFIRVCVFIDVRACDSTPRSSVEVSTLHSVNVNIKHIIILRSSLA